MFSSARASAQTPPAPAGSAREAQPAPAPSAETKGDAAKRPSLLPADPYAGATGTAAGDAKIDPGRDQQDLAAQGTVRPATDGTMGSKPSDVFSEDWWSHTRPIFEIHGYFRTRGELFHNFALGRHDLPGNAIWPHPIDHTYRDSAGQEHAVRLCGDPSANGFGNCRDLTQAGANMRFRLNPEIHISDNLRIMSQVDMLDNLVLGSTPDSYALRPASGGTGATGESATGYRSAGYNGYAPLGVLTTTQGAPTAGVNSWRNSIEVKRVWAEYMTPLGQLRFGRMPLHWGLGMLANNGDHIDADYQTNSDRIMFITGIKSIDLYFAGSWDFVSTGPTNASPYDIYGGQPQNTANLTNVDQWSVMVAKRTNPELQRLTLSRGGVVLNGGFFGMYRKQLLDVRAGGTPMTDIDTANTPGRDNGLERRGAEALIPDLWVQLLWNKLRFEAELASIYGSVENAINFNTPLDPVKIRMWGLATQTEYRAVEDKLRLNFGFGWASGDPWVEGLSPGASGLQPSLNSNRGPISTFRFHPAYYVDLILFRRLLSRVQGAYYFRPSVDYDFVRNPNGQKFGGGAAIIWSRASEFMQTPGNKRDLGVELNLQLYYQAKDGTLNDDPNKIGGFYAMLQYGVLFPLGGLSYLQSQQRADVNVDSWETSSAQTIRLFMGVAF